MELLVTEKLNSYIKLNLSTGWGCCSVEERLPGRAENRLDLHYHREEERG